MYLLIVLFATILLQTLYANLDPYLHEWDERFHALVARNLMEDPWIPYLRKNPLVPFDANSWCCNSVWLHKQPLFLWQSAISMKLFGVSEFTLRLPSVFLGTFIVLLVYRIARLLGTSWYTALLAALLMAFNYYQLELISGAIGMDHNDISFAFYILASIWSYLEYRTSKKIGFALLAGVFSGAAILNKWLVGLLVFLPWGIQTLYTILKNKNLKGCWPFLLGFLGMVVVALPWQLYILYRFPDLARYEFAYNSRHIWEALEGHVGEWHFYLLKSPEYLGRAGTILLGWGLFVSFRSNALHAEFRNSLLLMIAAVLVFFSFVAQTKMPSYVFIAVPMAVIFIGIGLQSLLKYLNYPLLKILFIALVLLDAWKPWWSYKQRVHQPERERKIANTQIYKNLLTQLPPGYSTVVNVNQFEDVELMFYQPQLNAYQWWIDTNELAILQVKGIKLAAFRNRGGYQLPPAYERYPELYWIDETLQ